MLGTVFYTIDQNQPSTPVTLRRRNDRCLFCHASSDTGRVPGLLMQSVYTNADGDRVFPSKSVPTGSSGPMLGRWGGWFATGTHGDERHLGNLMVESDESISVDDLDNNANIVDLSKWVDVTRYLSPHSDLVALLVLQHQVSLHNLLTSINHRARQRLYWATIGSGAENGDSDTLSAEDLAYLDQIAEEAVDGLLMVGRLELHDRMIGSSRFAGEFSSRGPFDSSQRSLRELDLQRSLFRFPCSYLIYSDSFDAIPDPVRTLVYQRLLNVLLSRDRRDKYAHLSPSDRTTVLRILRETKEGIPTEWFQK